MPLQGPTFALQPSAEQVATAGNYLGAADFNLLNQAKRLLSLRMMVQEQTKLS